VDNFNNNGVTNTPNPTNDDTSNSSTDYNSMQPQSNTLGVLPTDNTSGSTPINNQIPTINQPSSLEENSIDALAANPEDINAQLGVQNTQEAEPVIQAETPAEDTVPVVDVSGAPPVVDISAPLEEANVLPQMGETSIENTTEPITSAPEISSVQPNIEETIPTMEAPIVKDIQPVIDTQQAEVTPMEDMSSTKINTSEVFASVTPAMQSTPVAENIDSQPAFPTAEGVAPLPYMSTNLAQPLNTVNKPTAVETTSEEVVSTLSEDSKEGKDSSVVIIVLVVIIILLLAGIGYFGYQIFLS